MAAGVELPGGHALTPAAPQSLHHFTRLDQIDQLVGASEADADLGFMARLLALCSLPRTNPGNRKEFIRRNGPYTLGMVAGINTRPPYGNLPRLLLAWVCTEAVRTQRRELVLGRSLCRRGDPAPGVSVSLSIAGPTIRVDLHAARLGPFARQTGAPEARPRSPHETYVYEFMKRCTKQSVVESAEVSRPVPC